MRVGDFAPQFGKNIRYLRTLSKLSQKSLGILIGVAPFEIRVLENAVGVVHLDSIVLLRLTAVFGMEIADLMDRDLRSENYQFPQYQFEHFPAVYEDRRFLQNTAAEIQRR